MNNNGSKGCPHCTKTISANKEMCFAGVMAYGTLVAFEASKIAAATTKPKRAPRKVTAVEALDTKPKRVRKPRATVAA